MTLLPSSSAVSSEDLRYGLEGVLGRYFGETGVIVNLERQPSPCRSSYALEELDLLLVGGTPLRLVFKDLSRRSMPVEGQRAKPIFLHDPLREIEVYRQLIAFGEFGTPTCYGTVGAPADERRWLFLERIEGVELSQIGDFLTWQEAAAWLARFHSHFQGGPRLADLAKATHLLVYGPDYYRLWLKRARHFTFHASRSLADDKHRQLKRLVTNYGCVVERLADLPVTVIHGDFYAANVLVRSESKARRICPVDWEMAALGPGLIDLAALSAGSWNEEQRRELAQAYYAALTPNTWPDIDSLLDALDYCRVHLTIQWLGWSDVWSPPPEQAHDWLSEALFLAKKIGL